MSDGWPEPRGAYFLPYPTRPEDIRAEERARKRRAHLKRVAPKKPKVTATMLDKGIDARNHYKVPAKQWRKWSRIARTVFNRVYNFAINNQSITTHPKAPTLTPAHWKTTAWNMAWIAADATDDTLPDYIEEI